MLTLNILSKDGDNAAKEEIRMDQTPTTNRWCFVPLYKLSMNDAVLFWQIGFDGINNLEIKHGHQGGIIRTDRTEVKLNNSGRLMQEQALLDARQRYSLKYKEGYQPAGDSVPPMIKAMKGHEYKKGSIKNWPVFTQPKLDGIRMLCQHTGVKDNKLTMSMRSWLNNPFNHLHHIEDEIRDFFVYLPRFATLDGELYNHNMDFTHLTSAVKTVKTIHPNLKDVQFWIFDIDYQDTNGTPHEKRCELLINAFRQYIKDRSPIGSETDISVLPRTFRIVPTNVANNHDEIIKQHNEYVSSGYEGIMIKKISCGFGYGTKEYTQSLYKPGKGSNILKYKEFKDEEAYVISVGEAEGTEKGTAILNVQDVRGNVFPIRMRGDFERRRYWLQNPSAVIGKKVTIRYQELSIYGVPRFPVGVAIRDYE